MADEQIEAGAENGHPHETTKPPIAKFQMTQSQIIKWLVQDGWKVSDSPSGDAEWLVTCEDDAGRRLVVGQKKNRPDLVILQGGVTLPDLQREVGDRLRPKSRESMLWDLRLFLLQMGVEFGGIEWPLDKVRVSQRLYVDSLSHNEFVQLLLRIKNALLAVIWSVSRELAEPPPELPDPADPVN